MHSTSSTRVREMGSDKPPSQLLSMSLKRVPVQLLGLSRCVKRSRPAGGSARGASSRAAHPVLGSGRILPHTCPPILKPRPHAAQRTSQHAIVEAQLAHSRGVQLRLDVLVHGEAVLHRPLQGR